MLPEVYRRMIMVAAESGDLKEIDTAIDLVKRLAPEHFFKDEKDPALKSRVFHHMPYGNLWSGTFITAERVPVGNNDRYH